MSDAIVEAYSALDARMKVIDAIANNLANANTTGYKRDFGHILETEIGSEAGTSIDLAPGQLLPTGNELDAALNGAGFFVIDTPNGQRFTRTGTFALNTQGELVTKDGMKVLSTSDTPIQVGEGKVEIRDGGVVTVDGNEVGTLKVVAFADSMHLQKEGLNRFLWNGTPAGIQPVSNPPVRGGYLERSNVNAVDEMVHLMSSYRAFGAVPRGLRTLMTEMDGKLIQELGRIS